MATIAPVVGATVVVQPAKLYGRASPVNGKVKATRKKGYKFKVKARRKVGGAWWVRGYTYWYAYQHLEPIVHKRIVDVAALHARSGPSRKAKVVATKKRGYTISYVAIVKADGLSWLMSKWGHFYAAKHTRAYKVAPAGGGGKVNSPCPGYGISTPWRKRPNNRTYWQARGYHTGSDYASPTGTKVVAVRAGTIHRRWDNVLGNVQLLYADNGYTYWYCHLFRYAGKNGQKVKAGQVVGYVGSTGTGANGPHLHFEKRKGHTTSWAGTDLDPRKW